jgi:ribosomal protein S18 acetylase RimI-like enzyme
MEQKHWEIKMIRLADVRDLDEILSIVQLTIKEMHAIGNFQWDSSYPTKEHFLSDIENSELYVVEQDGKVQGFACINQDHPLEYGGLPWTTQDNAFVIHRLAINPNFRQRGLAFVLCKFAEDLALSKRITSLRIDTFSENSKAQQLFSRLEYQFVGEISFLGKEKPFYCYEKTVSC